MLDVTSELEFSPQGEMALQHCEGTRAKLNKPIGGGLRPILVARHDAGLGDVYLALGQITVGHEQRDLLRGPQSREEAKLIIIALGLAPVLVDRGDKRFGFLDGKGIDGGPILLGYPQAFQASGRIVLFRRISVAVVEGTSERAHDVVVSLLCLCMQIGDSRELGVAHLLEYPCANRGTPYMVQDLSIAIRSGEGQVMLRYARIDVDQELIEHVIAGPLDRCASHLSPEAVVGEFLREHKRTSGYALLDTLELHESSSQIPLGRSALECRAIAHALEFEVELNTVLAEGAHTAMVRFATHGPRSVFILLH